MWNRKLSLKQGLLLYFSVTLLALTTLTVFDGLLSSILPHFIE